jgi:outer membrane lipoprotein carrier protein
MRRFPTLFAAWIACVPAVCALAAYAQPAPAPAQSAARAPSTPLPAVAEVVTQVQNFYNKSSTFKADFQQKFTVKAYNQDKKSSGHVTFAKPGKMDWVYDDPKGNRVVSDGNLIKVYEAAEKQEFEQPVDKSQYQAVSFLTGTGKLDDSFDFALFSGDQMNFPGGYVLVGTPKQATPAYSKVLFFVDTGTFHIRRVLIIDGQGNHNRFDFDNARINEPVPPAQFNFTPPPGTSVIRP